MQHADVSITTDEKSASRKFKTDLRSILEKMKQKTCEKISAEQKKLIKLRAEQFSILMYN